MTATLLPNAKQTFLDGNGKPLAGGSVYFYIPNTSTFKSTWQDSGQTILNTNPVILDSSGEAVIYGSGTYRQVVLDVHGNLIWDRITEGPVGSADLSDQGTPGGAGLIGFDGNTLADQLKDRINRVVGSITELRALNSLVYTNAFVTGYYAPHDGGGGAYQYDPTDTTTADNGGTVIVAQDDARWKLQVSGPISLKQFGAKGDGTTDDSIAAQNWLNCFQTLGGGDGYVPAAHYIIMNPLIGYTNTRIEAEPGANFDFSQRASYLNTDDEGGLFYFRGTINSQILLTAQATLGATTITVADTSSLSVGALIELSQSVPNTGNFSESSVAVYSGQLNRIVAINGATITLNTTVLETLPMVNTPRIRLVSAPIQNVVIRGLTMTGKGRPGSGDGDIGLRIYSGMNCLIENCTFNYIDQRGLEFVGCLGAQAVNNTLWTDPEGSNTAVNYGITYTSSQDIVIRDNHISNFRHGVVSSNLSGTLTYTYFGINRFVTVSGNYITNTWHAGVATHNDVEHLLVEGNRIENCFGGVNMRDRNCQVQNNHITNCQNAMWLTVAPQRQVWTGNVIIDCVNALIVSSLRTGFDLYDIVVEGNSVDSTGADVNVSGIIFSNPGSTNRQKDIIVRGNMISNLAGTAGNDAAIRFSGTFSGGIFDNVVHNCSSMAGIMIDGAAVYCEIRRNRVTDTGGTAISIASTLGVDSYLTDNYIKGYTSGYVGISNVTNRNNDDGGSGII
jgi:hypothetical protein